MGFLGVPRLLPLAGKRPVEGREVAVEKRLHGVL